MNRSFILCVLLSLILLCKDRSVLSQTCSSNYVSPKYATSNPKTNCPVGFVPGNSTCITLDDAISMYSLFPCSYDLDCQFSWMKCVDMKCVPYQTHSLGDSCSVKSSCESGMNCYGKQCSKYEVKAILNQGESSCRLQDDGTNKFYTCIPGLACALGSGSVVEKCLQQNNNTEGGACGVNSKNAVEVCASGFYCNSTLTCRKALSKTSPCTTTEECSADLACRRSTSTTGVKTCTEYAKHLEYCEMDADCHPEKYGNLVKCSSNKCIRKNELLDGATCIADDDCWNGYCNSGKCQTITGSCYSSNDCPLNAPCVCAGGNYTSEPSGKCVASCVGQASDLKACLWNNGKFFTNLVNVGIGFNQFRDEESSGFTRCRTQYSRYYSCMDKVFKEAGIESSGSIKGISLKEDVNNINPSPLIPEYRNQAATIFSISILFVSVVTILLL